MIALSVLVGWSFNKYNENKRRERHNAQAQGYQNLVQAILPPLIRQEQKPVLYGRVSGLDYALKRFVANLSYFKEYVTVIVVDPMTQETVSNLSENPQKSQALGSQYLQQQVDLTPLPVEVVADDDTGQSELVGQLFVVKNPYSPKQGSFLAISSVVFMGLGLVYLLYKKVEHDKENRYLKAQLRLMRVDAMNDALRHIINTEFSNPLANRLQELDTLIESTLSRIQTATQDVVHDVRKAPLLSREEHISLALENLEALHSGQQVQVFEEIKTYLIDAKQTIETANWVIDNLQDLTSLESTEVCLQEQVRDFLKHLPPVLQRLNIEFNDCEPRLWVQCNAIHLKSIIKNILYNSSAAIKQHNRELRKQRLPLIEGKMAISCTKEDQTAGVVIEDNGPGIPKHLFEKLYRVPERLNQSRGDMKGNGSLIVYAYTRLHGGSVIVENPTKGGARVIISFPSVSSTTHKSKASLTLN